MEEKNYQWQPDDVITITGAEFSALYNGTMNFMMSPVMTPNAMLGVADASIVLKGIVEQMIEKGIAKEFVRERDNVPLLPQDRVPVDDEMPE